MDETVERADDPTAERIARNDATFRQANEEIRDRADEFGVTGGPVPFICECADLSCTTVVLLELDVYEWIRSDGRRFFNAPGHETAGGPHVRVLERRPELVVLEKIGRAGEVAEELDPRSARVGEGERP